MQGRMNRKVFLDEFMTTFLSHSVYLSQIAEMCNNKINKNKACNHCFIEAQRLCCYFHFELLVSERDVVTVIVTLI